jgi:hypothetical protein
VKPECLSKLNTVGEASLRRALGEFVEHYHAERNHQGKGNVLLFPSEDEAPWCAPKTRSDAGNASADCASTTGVPHEFLGPSTTLRTRAGNSHVMRWFPLGRRAPRLRLSAESEGEAKSKLK